MAFEYDKLYAQTVGERALAVRHLAQYAALVAPGTGPVLDIGSGWGHLLEALARDGHDCMGIDIAAGQVAAARAAGARVELVTDSRAWLDQQSAAGQRWRTIFLLDVLEHLPATDQLDLLASIHAALADGGRLVLRCPNPDAVAGMHMAFIDFTHRFTPTADALTHALTAVGFRNARCRDELPWARVDALRVRDYLLGLPRHWRTARADAYYVFGKRLFRGLRRWQLGSEIGRERARELPLSPNYLCLAEK